MSHFDSIDPNAITPLMPTDFLHSAAHLRTDLHRFTPPLHPTRVKFNTWRILESLTKRFSRADNTQLCTQTISQHYQIFNLSVLLMNLSQVEYLHNLFFNHSINFANYFAPLMTIKHF
jgi:hypothetical protein